MNEMNLDMSNGEIVLYQNHDGQIKLDVRLEDETVWLTQAQLCALLKKSKATISEHIKNVFSEGELIHDSTVRNFRTVQQEGTRNVERDLEYFNLDVIISVGYRVKSPQGTQFRIWATQSLKEYLIKGFTLNDDRFKSGNSMNYFNELQDRIREIRLSERFFYQKIKDIYTNSIDYNTKDENTITFFKIIQNKLLWAISEQTAAELVYRRVDASMPLLGMQYLEAIRGCKPQNPHRAREYRCSRFVHGWIDFGVCSDAISRYIWKSGDFFTCLLVRRIGHAHLDERFDFTF